MTKINMNKEITFYSENLSTPKAIAQLLERLVELNEISFDGNNPYWNSCGDYIDENLNK